jgi:hypothetical protein
VPEALLQEPLRVEPAQPLDLRDTFAISFEARMTHPPAPKALAAQRLVVPSPTLTVTFEPRAITRDGRFGPFLVTSPSTAKLVGATDAVTPEAFAAMLARYPGVTELVMVDAPGTHDDRANLRLGRMIRAAGLTTIVPENGSVRSGAVELFLAGTHRVIADGAEFAVHSWRDRQGREAGDFGPGAAQHRAYLDYYRDLGMAREKASRFYALTNSVGHDRALWLDAGEMRAWMGAVADAPTAKGRFSVAADSASLPRPSMVESELPASANSPVLALLDIGLLRFGVLRPAVLTA